MQRFILHKTFTLGEKIKTYSEQPQLANVCFIKVFYKTILSGCPRQPLSGGFNQEWSSYTGLTVIMRK